VIIQYHSSDKKYILKLFFFFFNAYVEQNTFKFHRELSQNGTTILWSSLIF